MAGEFDVIAKRVGEVCALSSEAMVRPPAALADLDRAEEMVSEDNGGNRSSDEADVRGSIIALPRRESNRGTFADTGEDDANALAQQLCEQVREFDSRPPAHDAGAKVVWLFR